MTIQLRTGSV